MIFDLKKIYIINLNKWKKKCLIWVNLEGKFSPIFMEKSVLYVIGVKFKYSEKATKLCKIFTLLLTVCITVNESLVILGEVRS